MELATACPAVVCCRCSPEQKAVIVRLIQEHTDRRTAAIGDGGNDVSMIQAASVGIGIVGKEGKQVGMNFHKTRTNAKTRIETYDHLMLAFQYFLP